MYIYNFFFNFQSCIIICLKNYNTLQYTARLKVHFTWNNTTAEKHLHLHWYLHNFGLTGRNQSTAASVTTYLWCLYISYKNIFTFVAQGQKIWFTILAYLGPHDWFGNSMFTGFQCYEHYHSQISSNLTNI